MKELEIGRLQDGLYLFSSLSSADCSLQFSHSLLGTTANSITISADVWHARLGHVPDNIMQTLNISCKSQNLSVCESYHEAKQTRQCFPSSSSTCNALFELIHVDLWGPYHVKNHNNCSYFLTVVDDISYFPLSPKSILC